MEEGAAGGARGQQAIAIDENLRRHKGCEEEGGEGEEDREERTGDDGGQLHREDGAARRCCRMGGACIKRVAVVKQLKGRMLGRARNAQPWASAGGGGGGNVRTSDQGKVRRREEARSSREDDVSASQKAVRPLWEGVVDHTVELPDAGMRAQGPPPWSIDRCTEGAAKKNSNLFLTYGF